MSEAVGIAISPTPESTLSDMIELGLTKHIAKLEEIGVTASREFALEQSLRKMKQEWVDICFELVPYRSVNQSIVSLQQKFLAFI